MPAPEQVYSSQVAGGATAPFGGSTPDAFGAGVGAQMERAGQGLEAAQMEARKLELHQQFQNDLASASKQASQKRLSLREQVMEMEQNPGPGGAGHAAGVRALYDTAKEDLLKSIPNQRVRQHIEAQFDDDQLSMQTRADAFEHGQRGLQWAQDVKEHSTFSGNIVRLTPSRETLVAEIASNDDVIDAGPGTPEQKRNYKAVIRNELSQSYVGALAPEDAKRELASGYLSTWMDPDAARQFDKGADADIRRQEHERQAQQRAALAQLETSARGDLNDVNSGVEVDPQRLRGWQKTFTDAGKPELAREFELGATKVETIREFKSADVPTLHNAQRAIEQHDGWQTDRVLVAKHDVIGQLIDKEGARVKDDKLGLFIARGGLAGAPLPIFNIADPAVMKRYFVAGEAAAQMLGGEAQYIPGDIAKQMRENFAASGPGQHADLLATLAGYDRDHAKALARQIVPQGQAPAYAALIDIATMRNRAAGGALMREALSGFEQIKANPNIVSDKALAPVIEFELGDAKSMIPGQQWQGIVQVAKGIYADRAVKGHVTHFDPELARASLRAALGEAGDGTGGVAKWRGSPYVLPMGMSGGDVELVLSRADGPSIEKAAFGGSDAPLWAGQRMTPGAFKKLTPVMVHDGLYMFKSGSGFALSQAHPDRNFILDVRQLGRLTASMHRPAPPAAAAPLPHARSGYEIAPILHSGGGPRSAYEVAVPPQ